MIPPVTSRTGVRAITPYTRIDRLPSIGNRSWTGCSGTGGSSDGSIGTSNVVRAGPAGRTRGVRCTASGMLGSSPDGSGDGDEVGVEQPQVGHPLERVVRRVVQCRRVDHAAVDEVEQLGVLGCDRLDQHVRTTRVAPPVVPAP